MLHLLSATELAQRLRTRQVSAVEVLHDHLTQIERTNPQVNAIVTLVADAALAQAQAADDALARGETLGALHGLPVAHKDTTLTKGIRTTFGSPLFRDHIPDQNSLIVERMQQAGAITLGKTNTPEFGAGSQTFNPVFGATHNPYDLTKTCGGSSGGAAVALACGMIALADGSDMGGSLRNPAGYCNVIGFRPSPGRVPIWPNENNNWQSLSVEGPMARNTQDVALLLSAIAGPDDRVPNSIGDPGSIFTRSLNREFKGVRVAWSPTLGGLQVDPRTLAVLESQRSIFEQLGCNVEEATPDFSGADEAFKTLRAWSFAMSMADNLAQHRDQLKDTIIWNTEAGLKLSGTDVALAFKQITQLFARMYAFMQKYEYIICPVSQIPPFDINQPYVTEINGEQQLTYIDWMRSCYYISATGHPAISVPGGFTSEGLPVGIQIVGRYRDEMAVLQLAHAFEQATGWGQQRPSVAK